MTINSQNTSINSKDPAQDTQNISVDVQNSSAMTETPQPMESTDLLPQGMPSADAEPHVPPVASGVAELPSSGAMQEVPPTDAGQSPPTKYVCPQAKDTPARPRTSHSNRFRNGNLGDRREIVVQDINHVEIIDADFFFSNLLPILPEAVSNCLDAVMTDLETKDYLSKTNGQLSWTAFSEKKKEDAFFSPFKAIFEAVVLSSKQHSGDPKLKDTHSFKMEPNKVPTSDRAEQMRPDACFVLNPSKAVAGKRTSWFDIACVGEFKTGEERKDVKDNIDKVIYGMHYIMASDPCRRFVTGFTVEKDTMALWFGSRSALYKCVFDYKKEPKKLVRLFMAFAFADANGQETGWDPTVEPIDINEERQYIYYVGGKKYVTKKLLVEYAADSLFGRATRVFLVTEEGKDDEHVLKDYWIDEGRSFERSIVEEMLRHVKDCCGKDAEDLVRRHIVTIMEEVDVEVGDEVDHTVNVMMRGTVPKIIQEEDLMSEKDAGRGGYRSEGLHSLDGYGKIAYMILKGAQTRRKTLRKMRHRRVVYKEYGTPIDKVKRLSVAITVLQGVTEALKYIHKAEWVHRDISAGNIYEYGGRGLLADFEYAKKMGTEAAHEVKTGTLYFMAFEAILRAYHYQDDVFGQATVEFFHNVIHDMESVHWVLFFILKDVDCKDEKVAQEARMLIVYKLFTGEVSSGEARHVFITIPSDTLRAYGQLLGVDGKEIFTKVSNLRAILNRYYRESEAKIPNGPLDISKFSGIHEEFMTVWKDCKGDLVKRDIHLEFKPLSVLKRPAVTELKRTRESKKSRTHESIPEEDSADERI